MEAYHGEVRVESTQGVGSSFILSFRAPQADTDTGDPRADDALPAPAPDPAGT